MKSLHNYSSGPLRNLQISNRFFSNISLPPNKFKIVMLTLKKKKDLENMFLFQMPLEKASVHLCLITTETLIMLIICINIHRDILLE